MRQPLLACLVFFFVALTATRGQAQQVQPVPNSWDGSAPSPGPSYPQGAYGYGAPYGNAYAINPQSLYMYDSLKKSPALGLVIEIFVPGVGSIYADHVAGALLTWGLFLGGIAVIIWGVSREIANNNGSGGNSHIDTTPLVIGVGMIFAGRIYGLVDAYSSSKDYNRALAQRLGLPPGLALGVTPIRMGESIAWGPALSLRF
jgi:hypothetical protein